MNAKKLPITIPPIIGYVIHAFPLSIIFNYKECLPWFFSNYIQLVCNTSLKDSFFDFFSLCSISNTIWVDSVYPGVPWININSIDGYLIDNCNLDINKLIKSSINQNNYVASFLDEFFIPNRQPYHKNSYFHENLIFGYDDADMSYDILGFNEKGDFMCSKVSYSDYEQGLKTNTLYPHRIKLLQKVNEKYAYELDLGHIRDMLLEYLNSKNSSRRLQMIYNSQEEYIYGISVYNELIRYFKLLADNLVDFDIRCTHILWEHKKCMLLRLNFISQSYPSANLDKIYNEYLTIEQKCLYIRNLQIKYYLSKHPKIIGEIISTLSFVSNKEQEVLPKLIAQIEGLI